MTFVFFNDCVIHDQNAFTHNKCGECGGCNEVIYKIRSNRKRKEKKKYVMSMEVKTLEKIIWVCIE